MDATPRRQRLLALLILLSGCASAQDRLEQGIELQVRGQHFQAAYRYIDALDKDPSLGEARQRLLEVSDSAVALALRSAASLERQGEHVTAAEWFEDVDALFRAARNVRVTIPLPDDYQELRRGAFDRAVESLIEQAEELRLRGDFAGARQRLVRARGQFEPSEEQRHRSRDAEVDLLIAWANAELEAGRYRAAFARAEEALQLEAPPDPRIVVAAEDIQARALELGTVVAAVLPVSSTPQVLETVGPEFAIQLADDLELDFWRQPPPFVAIADPLVVRREVRFVQRADRPLSSYEVADVLGRVGAEIGVLIEFAQVQVIETDVRTTARDTRTREGVAATYNVLEGNLVYDASLEVIVVDPRGRELRSSTFKVQENGRFDRGVYPAGNWRDLDLSRNELRLFDPDVRAEQHAAVARELLAALVPAVADQVFGAVLRQVP